ncbi:MAG: glycosyl hydrolase 115 family protein, partial [Muribaculaceae bacterium]|nr:glycosyl hydrolase 115 family protein [Muribaculaceae bacterium]
EADYLSREPSIRYRGIFINDEDWGLKPWSSNNYEKELGDIGPRTYARVSELLLRLKGNMLAPAMHSCTGAFYSHAGSKEVADSFGIIITTSHCEPMLFNNAAQSEWDSERDGEWNYITNRATIYDKFDRRLKEAGRYENIFAGIVGAEYRATLQEMLDDYYRLAWSRKPEYMGWEREWDAPRYAETGPTDYSFDNYNDARGRLSDYRRLSDEAERIMSGLPDSLSVPFFEMLGYPVQASYQMNRKYLLAQFNGELLARGDSAGANRAAMMAIAAHDSIDALCRRYNMALDGKWDGMMAVPEGFVAKYQNKPAVCFVDGVEAGEIDIEPVEEQYRHEGCHVVDLAVPLSKDGRSIRIIKGLGYDMQSVQLGEARPGADVAGESVTYLLPPMSRDSVEVTVYAFPFFPLNAMAGTQFGVSVDGGDMQTAEYRPIEWSHEWKTNVLRNSTENKFTFLIDPQRESHTVTLHAIDAGQIIQRIVVDYGGLKPSYVGPSLSRPDGR